MLLFTLQSRLGVHKLNYFWMKLHWKAQSVPNVLQQRRGTQSGGPERSQAEGNSETQTAAIKSSAPTTLPYKSSLMGLLSLLGSLYRQPSTAIAYHGYFIEPQEAWVSLIFVSISTRLLQPEQTSSTHPNCLDFFHPFFTLFSSLY